MAINPNSDSVHLNGQMFESLRVMMRTRTFFIAAAAALPSLPASAATIVVYTDPMTMERRTVVVDSTGPDRAFLCMLPPGDAGCRAIPVRRERR